MLNQVRHKANLKLVTPSGLVDFNTAKIMAIININKDSFYADSRLTQPQAILKKALEQVQSGAEWIDIGAESTRPNAKAITATEELDRIMPIINTLKQNTDIKISVDTRNFAVMQEAIKANVELINDITALQDSKCLNLLTNSKTAICLMHMQKNPKKMQDNPQYNNVVEDVFEFLKTRIAVCEKNGININRLIIDPGFGFGKTTEHNWQLFNNLPKFTTLNRPLLIGISRKSFIGKTFNLPTPEQRGVISSILHSFACQKGVSIIRTHDVKWTAQAINLAIKLKEYNE